MPKYKVSPQRAYMQAVGELRHYTNRSCISCREAACWYSPAGQRELDMSGMCEPCFDFVTWPGDEKKPAWFALVEREVPPPNDTGEKEHG